MTNQRIDTLRRILDNHQILHYQDINHITKEKIIIYLAKTTTSSGKLTRIDNATLIEDLPF